MAAGPKSTFRPIVMHLCCAVILIGYFRSVFTSARKLEDIGAPCAACRLFNIIHQKHPENKTDTTFCHYPCQCDEVHQMFCGNRSRIRDGCGCCYICASRLSEECSVKQLCDPQDDLYCDRKDDDSLGICKGKDQKNPCIYEGAVYQDGETFAPDCSQECTCQNGFYGCSTRCPHELVKPSELTCHEPKLIKVKDQCCREWTCQKVKATGTILARGLESQSLVRRKPRWYQQTTPAPPITPLAPPYGAPRGVATESCQEQSSSEWTPCSVTCGAGVSVRSVVDPVTCASAQELRICLLRPCDEHFNRTRCTPTYKTEERRPIIYQDCKSVRKYRLKFCDFCKKDKCCFPSRTRDKMIEFECTRNKRQIYKFLWIRKCRCAQTCYAKKKRRGGRGRGRRQQERRTRRRRERRRRKMEKEAKKRLEKEEIMRLKKEERKKQRRERRNRKKRI